MIIDEHVQASTITTFKVGGIVRYVITIESEDDVPVAVQFARERNLPLIPLGGGSNMLVRDGMADVVMVKCALNNVTFSENSDNDTVTVSADAGAAWDDLVRGAVERSWMGIENLSGIPGTMGGAVVQNIGAYGAALSESLGRVDAFDTRTMQMVSLTNADCQFGYRTSIFKRERDRYLITRIHLMLVKSGKINVSYKDLRERFGDMTPTVREVRDAVLSIRAKKFPPLNKFGTAGSFFLNPVMSSTDAQKIREQYPDMPLFDLPEGGVKVPIAWFLEHILKLKGVREGCVEAWRDHVLVLVAHDGARASDVLSFASMISERAKKELNVIIEPEVRYV